MESGRSGCKEAGDLATFSWLPYSAPTPYSRPSSCPSPRSVFLVSVLYAGKNALAVYALSRSYFKGTSSITYCSQSGELKATLYGQKIVMRRCTGHSMRSIIASLAYHTCSPQLAAGSMYAYEVVGHHDLWGYMSDFEVVTASSTGYCAISTSADWLVPKGETKERTAPP